MSSRVYALSIHADYKCRHSGLCCSTDWDVPVELPVYRSLAAAVEAGTLRLATAEPLEPFVVDPAMPEEAAAIFQRTDGGQCVFLERGSHLCVVHRDLGEPALPATCRHFPRLAVRDARGTFVTLSHFCPTAASMLFRDDVPLRIVGEPRAFPDRDYDGLSVGDDDLPPLLTPTMLMDLEGYTAWEQHMVARCASTDRPEAVLATLAHDARTLRTWKPGTMTLAEAVRALNVGVMHAVRPESLVSSLALRDDVMGAVPEELKPDSDEDGLDAAYRDWVADRWDGFVAPLNRYIAGKAFASWTAYQGRGVASIVRGLESALALVRVEAARTCRDAARALDADLLLEAFRGADFALNHLAIGEDLAIAWSRAEDES